MSPVHLRTLGIPRNKPEDREGLSRSRRPGGGHPGHSGGWKNIEGSHTNSSIHFPIQQKPQTRGLEGHDSSSSAPPTPERSFPMEHGQQEAVQTPGGEGKQDKGESIHYPSYRRTADPDREYSDYFRLTRSRPNQLSSGLTPFRNQDISHQESSFFTIPGSFQEKTRIQGQKQDLSQPKAERGRPNHPEAVGLGERSKQKPEIVANTSRISSSTNRNTTPTQTEHNVVTPESNLNSDKLWLQMSQFAVKAQESRDDFKRLNGILKRKNIGKHSPDKRSGFREEQPFRVKFKDKPRERVQEVTKKKDSCQNCDSTDHYANNWQKAKKKVYAIEKFLVEESQKEDCKSDSMGDSIREKSDDYQDPREEFLVEYQEETQIEIQDLQLEADMPQDNANKNLCKLTQDTQTFLVTPTKGMAYIHGSATKMTVCIENSQHPFNIYSGAHWAIVARTYLDDQFPNW
ncbi:hypothetical protein O181_018722 [Austropuccinia psidii MF-1]|uniref:Uncharacterized protein n=1 Tax=Austropuccinia psidii MF-1 TaxID=1389203 RepID=A0A9Q3GTS0_9BASI|nr:hypothetical protein [Austropuccinia psidii MF-1]